jgi:hypothetical protein
MVKAAAAAPPVWMNLRREKGGGWGCGWGGLLLLLVFLEAFVFISGESFGQDGWWQNCARHPANELHEIARPFNTG